MTEKSTTRGLRQVRQYFRALMEEWGPQDWWPAYSRLEVIVGAFLTQNTSWKNVEGALRNLRQSRLLDLERLREVPLPVLEQAVRPSGYFHQKAERLKHFIRFLDEKYAGSLARMFSQPTAELREELLGLNGVGPETADSILLYAGGHPVFVVDAYTRRVFERHGVLRGGEKYEDIRRLFEDAWEERPLLDWEDDAFSPRASLQERKRHKFRLRSASQRARVFDEYHALLVQVAKHHCRKKAPLCHGCPLQRSLPPEGPLPDREARGHLPREAKKKPAL